MLLVNHSSPSPSYREGLLFVKLVWKRFLCYDTMRSTKWSWDSRWWYPFPEYFSDSFKTIFNQPPARLCITEPLSPPSVNFLKSIFPQNCCHMQGCSELIYDLSNFFVSLSDVGVPGISLSINNQGIGPQRKVQHDGYENKHSRVFPMWGGGWLGQFLQFMPINRKIRKLWAYHHLHTQTER